MMTIVRSLYESSLLNNLFNNIFVVLVRYFFYKRKINWKLFCQEQKFLFYRDNIDINEINVKNAFPKSEIFDNIQQSIRFNFMQIGEWPIEIRQYLELLFVYHMGLVLLYIHVYDMLWEL